MGVWRGDCVLRQRYMKVEMRGEGGSEGVEGLEDVVADSAYRKFGQ